MRESPSGKASAFQADIRGFESRLPLLEKYFGVTYHVSSNVTHGTEALDTFKGPWRSG